MHSLKSTNKKENSNNKPIMDVGSMSWIRQNLIFNFELIQNSERSFQIVTK